MPDFGQYTEEEVLSRLKESYRYDAKTHACVRCGKPTKARLILGAAICNTCLEQ
jgi:ribosomal protein L37AE/L43A